jgi:FkbM family methyltransferase
MADEKRRDFLKLQIGAGTAFAAGLVAGGAAGAASATALQPPPAKPQQSFPAGAKHSYAQQGEDLILWNILRDFIKVRPVVYLDVGAHDPVVHSNTYLFYERECRGVLVEPNPSLWENLAKIRPHDVLVRGGIGIDGKDSEADYYVINGDGGLNTFSREMAESYPARTNGNFSIQKVLRLPLLDINSLMQKHWGAAPSLLSVDTEGFDLPILQSINWKRYRPAVVCVETLEFASRKVRQPILKLMAAQGYDVRGATFVNTIFVDRRLL